jgi:hypothetical protein
LKGLAIFDRLDAGLPLEMDFGKMWQRREIENYLCSQHTLELYARSRAASEAMGPLFGDAEERRSLQAMREAISEVSSALQTLGKGSPWEAATKVSDEFLTPVFEVFFKKLRLPNLMAKKNFHELASFVPVDELSPEIRETLDLIVQTARSARPVQEEG